MPSRTVRLGGPLDLPLTLGIHLRGRGDPSMRLSQRQVIRASRTADGPATIELTLVGAEVRAEAWGPGADRLLDGLPAYLGEDDRDGFDPDQPLLRELKHRMPGLRIGRTGAVMEALVPAILEQKVVGMSARRAWRGLIRRWGSPAPGPHGLWLQPEPATLVRLPYHEFHPLGVERRRADVIRRASDRAVRLQEAAAMDPTDAQARLMAIPGIGPWTAAEVAIRAFGDPDAVSVGDFHLPKLVGWALAGERRADDARMLELLEPYRGQRGRVIRLLEESGIRPEARGPRMAEQDIARI